ncbi:MAG: TetR/AcrR family transcriptional regulator [Clostridia bacterium]|nr:TetR/AcrR family transcriptional regulator [Clostridia bacterium]
MKSEDMRLALIKSTIQTISNVGIDGATTKLLATNAGVNEAYIYRIFGGKEQLFKETFTYIDKDFSSALLKIFPIVYDKNYNIKLRFRKLFEKVWQYALADKERCSFFIRYYYSRCYTNLISEERKIIYAKVMKKFNTAFPYGTDTWWLFNHIFDVIFSSAVKVLREEIPDTEETEEKIFNLLYSAIQSHLK